MTLAAARPSAAGLPVASRPSSLRLPAGPVRCSRPSRDARHTHARPESSGGRRGLVAAMILSASSLGGPLRSAGASSVFSGVYDDPNHPGCPRTIDSAGKIDGEDPVPFKRGAGCDKDTSLSPWTIQGKIDEAAGTIFIDFDQKDGSGEAFLGKWTGSGIELPDGTIWSQVSK